MKPIIKILAESALLIPAVSFAHTPYKPEECLQFSKFVYLAAKAKENGFDDDKIAAAAESSIQTLYETGSFIQDEIDAAAAMGSVLVVLSQEMSADMQMHAAMEDCIKVFMQDI